MPLDNREPELPLLPHSIEAEQALLGIMLTWPEVYERVADKLRPEHFYDGANQEIFETIAGIEANGRRAGMVAIGTALPERRSYLANLGGAAVSKINAPDYAETLVDFWLRREVIRIAREASILAGEPSVDRRGALLVEEVEAQLYGLAERQEQGTGLVATGKTIDGTLQRINDAWKNRGRLMGVTTGLIDLDKATGGLMPDELIILAGRPGMGKSTEAMTIAMAAARASTTVAFFSGEMSAGQLEQWELAEVTGVSADRQRRGAVSETELDMLANAAGDIRPLPLHFDDTPGLSVPQIRMRARRLKRKHGLGLIVVDHIGLLLASKDARRGGETAAMTEITGQLKRLAKELHVPIVALSQLNRAVEARDDKRPGMADLRQSGSIEQDADVVIFVYRQEYYLKRTEPERKSGDDDAKFSKRLNEWHESMDRCRGIAELIGAKNRSGPDFVVRCLFQPEHSRMANLARGSLI